MIQCRKTYHGGFIISCHTIINGFGDRGDGDRMLDAKLMRVLELLTDSKEHYMSSMELAQKCDVSKRTVQTRIQELRNSLEGTGATIEAKQHIGYRLHINDNDCYKHWLEQERSDSRLALPNSEQERFQFLLEQFLTKPYYFKLDDFSEELCISSWDHPNNCVNLRRGVK